MIARDSRAWVSSRPGSLPMRCAPAGIRMTNRGTLLPASAPIRFRSPRSTSAAARVRTRPRHHALPRHLRQANPPAFLRVLPAQDARRRRGPVRQHRGVWRQLKPTFVSVTYGAGGLDAPADPRPGRAPQARDRPGPGAAPDVRLPHRAARSRTILERYAAAGISNIMALRGDPPQGLHGRGSAQGSFRYAADAGAASSAVQRGGRAPGPARVRHRRGRVSGGAPGHAESPDGDGPAEGEGGRGGGCHRHAALLREPRFLRLPRPVRAGGDQGADHRGDHADHDRWRG